jgi:hypothetical protein
MPEYYTEKYADIHFMCGDRSGCANAAVLRYANACIRANEGYCEHLLIIINFFNTNK